MNRRSLFKSFLSTAAAITAASAMECLGLAYISPYQRILMATEEMDRQNLWFREQSEKFLTTLPPYDPEMLRKRI